MTIVMMSGHTTYFNTKPTSSFVGLTRTFKVFQIQI